MMCAFRLIKGCACDECVSVSENYHVSKCGERGGGGERERERDRDRERD